MLRLIVSILSAAILATAYAPVASAQQPRSTQGSRKAVTGVININTAAATELERLPGIGAKTAARIVEYRQKNGPFKKIEELMNVRGVGEKNFLKLKANITVTAPKAEHAGQPQ